MVERRVRPFLLKFAGALVLLIAAGALVVWGTGRFVAGRLSPDPTTIARASLQGLREQNRLSAFAARFVAVTTSRQSRFGLSAERTTIMPGDVRYEVDLGKLTQRDVAWDAATGTLSVRLPDIEVSAPQIDLAAIRSYGAGGMLETLTDARETLDAANRTAGQAELVRQAHGAVTIRLAKEATRRAVERSFALPLRAAGMDAKVVVRFADDPVRDDTQVDRSRSLDEVFADGR